jgi:hypothetical protein
MSLEGKKLPDKRADQNVTNFTYHLVAFIIHMLRPLALLGFEHVSSIVIQQVRIVVPQYNAVM